ncbi:MAG: glycoside hydrolase family 5 protein [Puniceicoccales bacterium]|nr:glycoside hydrolase family 5 protein [Puniceicoccales bacterium]
MLRKTFWDTPKTGTNMFNARVLQEDIRAAKKYKIAFIRLAFDKFPTKRRDFLIGNTDRYEGLDPDDLLTVKKVLDTCSAENMPVVITLLSLPGSRWSQHNGNEDDLSIWNDVNFQQQAAKFWKDLASELNNYPIIVGYNILNEPHPERIFDRQSIYIENVKQKEVQHMLSNFYNLVIQAIRQVDGDIPIIVDSFAYADPNTFKYLNPINDENILYSFHMYEPYEYTNHQHNHGQYTYPGKIEDQYWDKKTLTEYVESVNEFQKCNKIPSNRILVGEFGCYRKQKGLSKYFSDLISIFNEKGWHWAFYAFREDSWDGMDYELGDKQLPWSYWESVEKGKTPVLDRKGTHPQFSVLKKALAAPKGKIAQSLKKSGKRKTL